MNNQVGMRKNQLEWLIYARNVVNKMLFIILSFVLFVILALVIWQVVSRYLLREPSVFTEELVRFFLIWLGILAAVYTFGSKKHIALEFVYNKFPVKVRFVLSVIHHIVILAFAFFFFIYGGTLLIKISSFQSSSVLGIQMSYINFVFPVGGVLLFSYQIINLLELFFASKAFNIKKG